MATSFLTKILGWFGFGKDKPEQPSEAPPAPEVEEPEPLELPEEEQESLSLEELGVELHDLPPLELPEARATLPLESHGAISDEYSAVSSGLEEEVDRLRSIIEQMQREPKLYEETSEYTGPFLVKVFEDGKGEAGGKQPDGTFKTCSFTYTVKSVAGTTIATEKAPAKLRNADTQYHAAPNDTFGWWDPVSETLLVAYGEREATTTECET